MTQPIGIGLVGIGRAGWSMHCEELLDRPEQFRLVAGCDLIAGRCRRLAERFACATYARIEELIADPRVELVDIATRSCDHFAHARLALEAGKDVCLEKPMCVTYDEVVHLRDIAAQSTGTLYIRHNRRFEPGFQHAREIIASGILGEVYEITLRRVQYHRRDDWQTLLVYGGGQSLNWGPHIVDHALQLLEAPVVRQWSDLRHLTAAGDADDYVRIVLTGANGRTVDLKISGGAALDEPEYQVWGTRGALRGDGETWTLRYLDPGWSLPPVTADPGTPGGEMDIPVPNHHAGVGAPRDLPWIEETIPVRPAAQVDMTTIWDRLYDSIRRGASYPITIDQAVEGLRVISEARAGTRFAIARAGQRP